MTYVVTESCIRCKYTDCVDVCPVDCFREGPNFLVIDPDECIDCTLCVAECPVEAIYAEDDVPDDQKPFTSLNAELAKLWKPIIERKPAPPDWPRPEGIVVRQIDPVSGMLAGPGCSGSVNEFFIVGTDPTQPCVPSNWASWLRWGCPPSLISKAILRLLRDGKRSR